MTEARPTQTTLRTLTARLRSKTPFRTAATSVLSDEPVETPEQVVRPGDQIDAVIAELDFERRRVRPSARAAQLGRGGNGLIAEPGV